MAQSQLDYNSIMFGIADEPLRVKDVTILSGEGDLSAGTVLIWGAADKFILPDAVTQQRGWVVLLEDVDASAADATGKVGIAGGVWEDKLIFEGTIAAYSETVRELLQMNSIYVQKGTNSIKVAGE